MLHLRGVFDKVAVHPLEHVTCLLGSLANQHHIGLEEAIDDVTLRDELGVVRQRAVFAVANEEPAGLVKILESQLCHISMIMKIASWCWEF